MTDQSMMSSDDEPIGEGSSLLGFLHILKKAHSEISGAAATARFLRVTTKRSAKDYMDEVMPILLAQREARRQRRRMLRTTIS
jgi:hypothetical protein